MSLQSIASRTINSASDSLRELSLDIHAHPEENYEEVHAHAALTQWLTQAGFDVTPSAYGMDTAFEARRGSGGPTIAILSEYDALPGIGHACGHNLIAISGLAAGLAVAETLEREGIEGSVHVLGSPAEEGGGGKIRLINEGAFEDVGAAMMIHPGPDNIIYPYVLAIDTCYIEFRGQNAHAAGAPWQGRNSLDALVLAYQAIALMRQQTHPSVRIHGKIHHGGEKPNIIPDYAQAEFYVRAPYEGLLNQTMQRVEDCFAGAAQATSCEWSIEWQSATGIRYSNMATNGPLAEAYGQHWLDLGVRATDLEGDKQGSFGSTDMGNVSHVVPSIHPMYFIPHESGNHTPAFTAAAATEEGHAFTLTASQAMAQTALDWLTDPDLRDRAQAAFDATHGN